MSEWLRQDTLQAHSPDGDLLEVVEEYDEDGDETGLIQVTYVNDSKTTEMKLTVDAAETLRDMLSQKVDQMRAAEAASNASDEDPDSDEDPAVAEA